MDCGAFRSRATYPAAYGKTTLVCSLVRAGAKRSPTRRGCIRRCLFTYEAHAIIPTVNRVERTGNVGSLLRTWAERQPSAPFLVDATTGRTWSYAEVDALTDTVASELTRAGVRTGDRVGVVLPNGPHLVALYLATLKIGGVFSPVNPACTADEIRYVLRHSDPRLVCTRTSLAAAVTAARATRPIVTVDADAASWFSPGTRGHHTVEPSPDAAALLLYTSGSTGKPKGALLTHDNLLANAAEITAWLRLDGSDRVLCIMPLFHANALVIGITTPLYCGASTVVCERFSARGFWPAVQRFQPTTFGSVATILTMVLGRGGRPPAPQQHRLRFALCGSAPVPVEVIRRFQDAAGVPVIEGYGLTECTCRATFNPLDGPRPGSAGLPIGNALRIADDAAADCPPGVVGEVILQGRNVMPGYFRAPEATQTALRGGWLRTGDLGYRTEDGFLYLVGRTTDMIIRGGENIYPREIEDVLYKLPGINEAAVIGVPDPLYGEAAVACVAADPARGLTSAQVLAHCRDHLAPFKCPHTVHFLDALPKNATGKLDKSVLRLRFQPVPGKS